MLVLTRKEDESIVIDDKIEVKIIGIEDGKVKLGISAPKSIDIHRKEIYLQIQEENKKAAQVQMNINDLGELFKNK